MSDKREKRLFLVEAVMIALTFVCACSIASHPYTWFDESFSVSLARRSVPELIRITGMDVHPPLYYLAVKLFITVFGDSLFVYHLPSLLCYVALMGISVLFFHRNFNARLSLLVTTAFCSVPGMLEHALWIRMYSMAMLLVISGFFVAYLIMKKCDGDISFASLWKHWTGLALINVAAAYTHYFAGVAAAGISLFLLVYVLLKKKRVQALIPWLIHCAIMVVLYLPWLPILFKQMSRIDGNFWIEPLSEMALHTYPELVFSMKNDTSRQLLIIIFLTGCFLFLVYFSKETKNIWVAGCFAVILFWLAFGIGYSVLKNPILVNRYFVILIPLLWILPLYGHALFNKGTALAAVILVFTACFIQNYEEQYDHFAKSYSASAYSYLDSHLQENDVFFHSFVQNMTVYEAYFPQYEHYVLDTTVDMELESVRALTNGQIISSVEELPDGVVNIWCSDDGGISQFDMSAFETIGYGVEIIELRGGRLYHAYLKE